MGEIQTTYPVFPSAMRRAQTKGAIANKTIIQTTVTTPAGSVTPSPVYMHALVFDY